MYGNDWQQWFNQMGGKIKWLEQTVETELRPKISQFEKNFAQLEQASYPQQYGGVQSSQIDSQRINDLYRRLQPLENWLPQFPQFQYKIEQLEKSAKSYHTRISKLETPNSSPQLKTPEVNIPDIGRLLKTVQVLQKNVEQLTKENKEIKADLEHVRNLNSKLNERLKQIETAGDTSRGTVQSSIVQPAQKNYSVDFTSKENFVDTDHVTRAETRRRDETPPPRTTNTTNSRLRANQNSSIVAKYNRLIGLTGVEFKRARDDFRREYEVKAFKCGNVEARMNNPNIPPDFVDDSIHGNGNYWAVPSDAASFYVFPNVRVYNDNLHNERAMGIVFDSNFQGGKTYEKVSVESPAKFSRNGNNWILEHKGRLVLE